MMAMKTDMAGAAAVLAATAAVARLGLDVEVRCYVPATDNMTGPDATRPGDVLRLRNGKTIEVLNTDAEGRLVLADALAVASEAHPDAIVDVATLTGACKVALGSKVAGVMGNDDALARPGRGGRRGPAARRCGGCRCRPSTASSRVLGGRHEEHRRRRRRARSWPG